MFPGETLLVDSWAEKPPSEGGVQRVWFQVRVAERGGAELAVSGGVAEFVAAAKPSSGAGAGGRARL